MLVFALSTLIFSTTRWICERARASHEKSLQARMPYSKFALVLTHVFKFLWFVAIVSFEYVTLRNQPWLPKFLGGPGDASLWQAGPSEELRTFYEVQMAYHVHSMLFSVLVGSKKEMHLHHIVTIFLIYLSNHFGYRRIGAVVFVLHDAPDIVGCAIKAAVILENIKLILGTYVPLLLTWGYFRLYLLPLLIIDVIRSGEPLVMRTIFSLMLSTLACLHYFWYSQFLAMAYNYSRTGKSRDISEKNPHPIDKSAPQGTTVSSTTTNTTAAAETAKAK
jgi:hypothetical protein